MHVLDMGNNSMTAEGAASLAAYMETHRELKDLNLYMNDIGSAGLEKVLSACCLDTLALTCVPEAVRCRAAVWPAVSRSSAVCCCQQIAASLKGSAYLEALDMGGNNITADGIKVSRQYSRVRVL
jgi:Leucine Rich repeat